MKRIFKYVTFAALVLTTASCAIDYVEPDKNKLPQASALTPEITVDQETNMVTFSIKEKNVVPLWIFGDEKVDGSASKKYAYTQNGIILRIREAGTHSVELKAYNANGISQGSQIVTFELQNTYRDPFNATPYMKAIANTWVWDHSNAGHFGCGESGSDGLNWWSAGAEEKADWSLYDDLMTFDADGNYSYDPGDGFVYVNKESGFKSEYYLNDDQDYKAPIDAFTSKYTIENKWNDAGIEEIYLVLEGGKNLSYIPNPDALTNPRYRFIETTTSKIKKNLQLINDNGSIAWHYSFVPYVKQAGPEELLAGTEATGKAWVMDAATKGHLACGPSLEDPSSWWAAGAYEKDGSGMYDDVLIFYPDGSYSFSAGEDGMIYVNKDVTAVGAGYNPGDGNDFSMPWTDSKSSYSFDGEILEFPAETIIGYIPSDDVYNKPYFHVTEVTETTLTIVYEAACSWQWKFKARDVDEPAMTFAGQPIDGTLSVSLTKGQNIPVTGVDLNTTWVDPDYFTLVDAGNLKFNAEDGEYSVVWADNWFKAMPLGSDGLATYADGKALWSIGPGIGKPDKAHSPGWSTGSVDLPLAKISDNTYQLTGEVAAGESFKVFGQADWGTEWGVDKYGKIELGDVAYVGDGAGNGDSGNIYINSGIEGFYTFTFVDNDGILDVSCKPYTGPAQTDYDIEGATNLWRSTNFTMAYWYADGSWTQIANPEFEWTDETKKDCKLVIPNGIGGSEWQGQTQFQSEIPASASKAYDFCVTVKSSTACTITLKIAWLGNDNDHAMLYDNAIQIPEDEPFTIKKDNLVPDCDYDKVTFFLDFGRTEGGSVIEMTDFCFQEHKEK